jgi:hypothetical protein
VIPGLALLHAPPTGYVEPTPILAPDPITDIQADSDRVVWTYDEPDGFTGYIVKTTLVAGRSWTAATLLKTTSSAFVLNSELPPLTAEVLIKPTRLFFEAIREARVAPDLDDPPPPPPPKSVLFPGGPWIRVAPYASRANKRTFGSASALQGGINTASPGDTLVLNANSSNSTLTIGCKGTQERPIIICSDTDLGNEANYRQLTGGNVIFKDAEWVIFRGFKTVNLRFEYESLSHCQVECNRHSGLSSGGDAYEGPVLHRVTGTNVADLLIGFNHEVGDVADTASFFDVQETMRPKRFLITHNFTDGMKGTGKVYQPGRNPRDGQHNLECVFQYHLDKDRTSTEDLFESKHNGTHFRYCTLHMADTSGSGAQQTKVRHGRIDAGSTSVENGRGNVFEGLLYIQDGKGASPSITIRGIHHKVINCWVLKLGPTERPSLSSTPGNGSIEFFVGNRDPYQFPELCCLPKGKTICRYVGAAKCLAAGNRYFTVKSTLSGGQDDGGVCGDDYKPQGWPADRCWIPTGASEKSRNSSFSSSGFTNTVTSPWPDGTAWADADINKVPLRLFPEDVGPNAWDRTFVLERGGPGPGPDPVPDGNIAIGSDYTVNWGAQLGRIDVEPPPPPPPPGTELPTPTSTVTVGNMADLQDELSSAPPGRRIILSNGTYTGDLTVTRSGTSGNPIQIYAANILQATITGRVKLTGTDVIISRVDVPKGIDLNGNRTRANRCRCNGVGGLFRNTILITGDDCTVDWCETSFFDKEGIRNEGYRNTIRRCVLTGKNASTPGTASAVISSGSDTASSAKAYRCLIIENLVYANDENNGIELKSSYNEIEGNTILGGGGQATNINNRHGIRNTFRRNWVEGGQLQLSDHDSVAVRNKGKVAVNAGKISGDVHRTGPDGIIYAEDAIVIDHDGSIQIGFKANNTCTHAPERTILENCTGTVTTTLGQFERRSVTSYPRPTAPTKLTTADVGPFGSES